MNDQSLGRADGKRIRFKDRMGHGDKFDVKATQLEPAAKFDHMDRHLIGEIGFGKLGLKEFGGKRRCIDRAFQPWPKIWHRPKVIFVGMGQNKTKQLVLAVLDKGRVGHHNINTRKPFLAKGNPHINHQPLVIVAIKVQVHANFARTAKRHEQHFVFWQIQIH